MLLRLSSIFVHGVYFQRSELDEAYYVHGFVNFLPDAHEYVGFTIGERVARVDMPDRHETSFRIEPAAYEADVIVRSLRASRFHPAIMQPDCHELLDSYEHVVDTVWAYFGLACCAIMVGDAERAQRLLRNFDDIVTQFESDNARRSHELYLTLESHLHDLDWCRKFLWQRCEESVKLKKLEKIAELSGWRPGQIRSSTGNLN